MKKSILIVEDSPQWQRFHLDMIKSYNKGDFEIRIASSAREGLEIVQENTEKPFDLIFSDMQMESDFHPDFAGEWFIKQVKQIPRYNKTLLVIVSATYNIAFIAQNLGTDYLSKRSIINYPQAYYSVLDSIV